MSDLTYLDMDSRGLESSIAAPAAKRESRLLAQKIIVYNVVLDYLVVLCLLLFSAYLRYNTSLRHVGQYIEPDLSGKAYFYPVSYFFWASLLAVASFGYNGLYHTYNCIFFRSCVMPLVRGIAYWVVALLVMIYLFKIGSLVSRLYVILTPLIVGMGLLCWRFWLTRFLSRRSIVKHLSHRILFVGWTEDAEKLCQSIHESPTQPYEIVGCIPSLDETFNSQIPTVQVVGDYGSLREVLKKYSIDIVILADMDLNVRDIIGLSNCCEKESVQFKVIPSFFRILLSGLNLESISGVPILGVASLPLDFILNRLFKRTIDIIGAIVGLVLFGPIILLFGLLVYRESPGPIIYRQRRLGRNGVIFDIFKIRSMKLNADSDGKFWTTKNDPRRLKIGAFMRSFNIDELPQFWNVLKGEMSLVGPRPEVLQSTKVFMEEIPHYNARHGIKPGITGWAQVNGLRGDTDLGLRIRYDLYYLENWSLWLDFLILCMTFYSRKNAG